MLTFLGCFFLLLIASPLIIYYGVPYYYAIRNEMTPPSKREFKMFVMNPIPKGVTHIWTVGGRDSMTSVLVIIFDEDPATFPVILDKWLLHPVPKEEQTNCEALNFSDCPKFDGADYFEDVHQAGNNSVLAIKTNPSRTKVYFAVRGVDPHS